jgi:CRP-like cAMP-binding protein
MDVYGRVANALLDLSQLDSDGRSFIKEKVSRQNIAKTVGASREMVSRVMKDLEDKKYIASQEDGSIFILKSSHTLF